MAPPAPNKIVRPAARQTGLRKVPNVVAPQEETAVVDTTTDKEPAVLANTRKEPVVVATTTRHQQLMGTIPLQRPAKRSKAVPPQPPASQSPPPKDDVNDDYDDDDVHIDIDAYLNTGCNDDRYMPAMDHDAESFRSHDDQPTRNEVSQRLTF